MKKDPAETKVWYVREPMSLYDAKTHLSELVELASAGEEIVIMKSGKPMARLVGLPARPLRKPGRGKGSWVVKEDFDDPLPPDIQAAFEAE